MDQLSVDMASSAMLRGMAHASELNALGAGIQKMALTSTARPRLHVATNQISELADPGDREVGWRGQLDPPAVGDASLYESIPVAIPPWPLAFHL